MEDRMREKLIELLDDIQRCGEDFDDYEIYGMRLPNSVSNDDVADHLIANGVTIQKWIPVTERLPEDNERVLVYHDDGMIRFGINKGGFADVVSTHYLQNNHRTWFSRVTHWMPLPEPPKGE
jgi:hypothetical protein